MKKTLLLLITALLLISTQANAYTIDGTVLLSGQTDHSGTMVIFTEIAPGSAIDTVYTDATGYFSFIPSGNATYDILYKKDGYEVIQIADDQYFSANTNLGITTLRIGLDGDVYGTLTAGTYIISYGINVPSGQSLTIEPSVTLMFKQDAFFTLNGNLIAEGTNIDSILFISDTINTGITWNGIKYNHIDSTIFNLNYTRISNINVSAINIYTVYPSSIIISNSKINNCYGSENILNFKSDSIGNSYVVLDKLIFENNSTFSSRVGVFIENYYNVVIGKSIFFKNNFSGYCPIIIRNGEIVRIENSSFNENIGYQSWANSIYLENSMANILNCSFKYENNYSRSINCNATSIVNVYNSVFDNIYFTSSYLLYKNCIFKDCNIAPITNPSIINNLYYNNANDSDIANIVGQNANGDDIDQYFNIFYSDPLLDTNGIPQIGSPCIDAGTTDTTGMGLPLTDYAGNLRVVDGNYDNDTIIDIGAYEYGAPFYTVHDLGITVWQTPETGCNLNGQKEIKIKVKNFGTVGEQNFTVSYSIDSGLTWQTEQFTDVLPGGNSQYFTFAAPANFNAGPDYYCFATVNIANDEDNANDTLITHLSSAGSLQIAINNQEDALCNGSNEGSFTAVASVGSTPYTYSLGTEINQTGLFENLQAGNYTVTVNDNAGCYNTASVNIGEPNALVINITPTSADCGEADGVAIANVTGGTAPYTYLWSNGDTTNTADTLSAATYSLQVTDANACFASEYFTIVNDNAPIVNFVNQENITCNGLSDGAVELIASGGSTPYSITWSNGEHSYEIDTLTAGAYIVSVTDQLACVTVDTVIITEPDLLQIDFDAHNTPCGWSNGYITANPVGGTANYYYNWSNGETTATINTLAAGNYCLTLTDAHGCNAVSCASISEDGAPIVDIDTIMAAPCNGGGSVFVSVSGGSTGNFTYNWSNGTFNQDLTGAGSGNYTLTVTDAGCQAIVNAEIPQIAPEQQPICIVTVDSTSGKNLVVWEAVQSGIDYYNIYREGTTAGIFDLVSQQDANLLTVYEDDDADPFVRSYRYKISAVDQCGVESELSDAHKILHLNMNIGLGGAINLIWDDYEGFNYDNFIIIRHNWSTGWTIVDTLPTTLHSYSDVPPNYFGLWYGVTVQKPGNACLATKTSGGPYNQSISNIDDYESGETGNDYYYIENEEICDGSSINWQGGTYTEAGTYYAEYQSEIGLDSIYELNLTVNPIYNISEDLSLCGGDSVLWEGNYYTSAGAYTANYQSISGCDSIRTLNLTQSAQPTPTIVGNTNCDLYSSNTYYTPPTTGSTYTWNTENGDILSQNSNSVSIFWLSTGLGKVKLVEKNSLGCESDTIVLEVNVGTTGLNSVSETGEISIYPNPATDNVELRVDNSLLNSKVEIINVSGKIVEQFKIQKLISNIDLSKEERGIYFVKIISENGVYTQKLIVE